MRSERLESARPPAIAGSRAGTRLGLVAATALPLALKFITHSHFRLFGFGFWGALVLTVALVALGMRVLEADGAPATEKASRPGAHPQLPPGTNATAESRVLRRC